MSATTTPVSLVELKAIAGDKEDVRRSGFVTRLESEGWEYIGTLSLNRQDAFDLVEELWRFIRNTNEGAEFTIDVFKQYPTITKIKEG
jgi:hypothetical protein